MADKREFPQAELARVHELVNLAKERIEEGPHNYEWLLDYNLPDLYVAICGLYAALGESERLEQFQAAATRQ